MIKRLLILFAFFSNLGALVAQDDKKEIPTDSTSGLVLPSEVSLSIVNLIPPNPDAAALGKYGEIPVSLYTGTPNINIPLYNITGDVNLPVSLSYHASGVKVDEVSSMVGLGWVLNAGGVISRTVRGLPDDRADAGLQTATGRLKYYRYRNNLMGTVERNEYIACVIQGGCDTEPDLYNFNFSGRTGQFVFDADGNAFVLNNDDSNLKIIKTASGFLVTDEQGFKYYFNDVETTRPISNCNGKEIDYTFQSAWYMSSIVPLNGRPVTFTYHHRANVNYEQGVSQTATYILPGGGTAGFCSSSYSGVCTSAFSGSIRQISSIQFGNGSINFSYELRQDIAGLFRISQMEVLNFNSELIKRYSLGYSYDPTFARYYLTALNDITSTPALNYGFTYYMPGSLPNRNVVMQDHWGYYNNNNPANNRLIPEIPELGGGYVWADRSPDPERVKYGMLSQITYPTGGHTTFEFEINDAAQYKVSAVAQHNVGGVRIKKMVDYPDSDSPPLIKRYDYKKPTGGSSGITSSKPVYAYYYEETSTSPGTCQYMVGSATSQSFAGSATSGTIGYSHVTEYSEDGTALNGKTEYTFTSFTNYQDFGNADAFPFAPVSSWEVCRGKPLDTKTYRHQSGNFILVHKSTQNYEAIHTGYVEGTRIKTFSRMIGGPITSYTPNETHFRSDRLRFRLLSSTEYAYDDSGAGEVSTTTQNIWTANKVLPDEVRTSHSKTNTSEIRRTLYAYDLNITGSPSDTAASGVRFLREANALHAPVETQYLLREASTDYLHTAEHTVYRPDNGLPYKMYSYTSPQTGGITGWNTTSYSGGILQRDTRLYENIHFRLYDTYGHPLEIFTRTGYKIYSFVWGYDARLPILKAVNLSYSAISSMVASPGMLSSDAAILAAGATLRTTQALVDTYLYKPLAGIKQHVDPSGLSTKYFFDGFNRLRTTRNHDDHITHFYSYHYPPAVSKAYVNHSVLRVQSTFESDAADPLKSVITRNYVDGLGRTEQQIGYRQSPTQKDIVFSHSIYNGYGILFKNYLPYADNQNTGAYRSNAGVSATAFYTDGYPLTETTVFDNSPLNRSRESFGAGSSWRTSNKRVISTQSEAEYANRRIYEINAAGNIVRNGFYPSGSIRKESVTDEQGNTSESFKDREGKTIASKQGDAVTYYIYHANGKVAAVIQPEGYALDAGFNRDSENWQRYVFAYEYNNKGLAARKHIPGAGWIEIVYDRADRVVMQQDARQKLLNKWAFTKYDAFDRVAYTGETTNTGNRSTLQNEFDTYGSPHEYWTGGGGWNGGSYPGWNNPSGTDVQQYYFYDQYDFVAALNSALTFNPTGAYHSLHGSAKGKLTGTVSYDLANHDNYFMTALYYDTKSRTIQQYQTHLKSPDVPDRTDYEYNFAGEILRKKEVRKKSGSPDINTLIRNEYDHTGRTSKTFLTPAVSLSEAEVIRYTYDEIGRLIQKKYLPNDTYSLGNPDYITRPVTPSVAEVPPPNTEDLARKAVILEAGTTIDAAILNTYLAEIDDSGSGTPFSGLQTMDYAWHIRGGLHGINLNGSKNPIPDHTQGDLFAYKLDYEAAGQWNGNIGRQSWNHVEGSNPVGVRNYLFTYDGLDRLKTAIFSGLTGENYSIQNVNYDRNGNILNLHRKGKVNASTFGDIDNLTYTYSGNRLTAISDAVSGNENTGDFRHNGSGIYTYWENGALKSDANKGVSLVEHNTFLNKISKVTYSNGHWITFTYDGSGTLIKRENSNGDYWEYAPNGFIFKNGQPYSFAIPEGRAIFEGGQYKLEFEYRDVWNNLRVVFGADGNRLVKKQQADYDVYGYEFNKQTISATNYFKYQNQERIEELGPGGVPLNIDFFKYRPSDPTIGRFWSGVDPLAEQFYYNSTYALQENKFGLGVELEGAEMMTFKEMGNWLDKAADKVLSFTDVNDATVVVTHFTRNGNAINVDGSPASKSDKYWAAGGALLPAVSGSAAKKIVGAVADKVKDILKIDIPDADKVSRELLNPPTKPGNAPTFKKDGTPVEIHHEGQNAKGPFKEMHVEDHRKGENFRKNHPSGQTPLTKEERKEFNKARDNYWKKEFPKE